MPRRPGLPAAPGPPPTLPRVHRTGDHPAATITRNLRTGGWTKIGRGMYADSPPPDQDQYARAGYFGLATIAAAEVLLETAHVLSHVSAAVLWNLPVPPSTVVHVTQRWSANRRMSRGILRHVIPLSEGDVAERGGHLVTSLERTAVDCALLLGPVDGLVVMDAAFHHGANRDLCLELLGRRRRSRGVRTARAVLEVADDGAESPGETRARLALLRLGVMPPQTQLPVMTDAGEYWCDLGWDDWRVVGEYDGVAKYTARGSAAHHVLHEKRRQELIEETGRAVLRMTKDDVARPALLERRVRRYLPPEAFTYRIDPHLR